MFFLSIIIFLLMLYSVYNNFNKKEYIQSNNKIFKDNIAILKKLNYYNFNYNLAKSEFLSDAINYILFSRNTSFNELFEYNYDETDIIESSLEKVYSSLSDFCVKNNKVVGDLTINEIFSFIKNNEEYKKVEKNNDFNLRRVIELSKFLNDQSTERLIDALTYEELEVLTS